MVTPQDESASVLALRARLNEALRPGTVGICSALTTVCGAMPGNPTARACLGLLERSARGDADVSEWLQVGGGEAAPSPELERFRLTVHGALAFGQPLLD